MDAHSGSDRVPVPGSEREPLPGSRAVGDAPADEPIEVTVLVRRKQGTEDLPSPGFVTERLSREEFDARYGADPADIQHVRDFADAYGLEVVEASTARRSVVLSGTVEQMSAAFGVDLREYEHPAGAYRGRTGPIYVPPELADVVVAVVGLDDRPQATPHFQVDAGTETRLGARPPGSHTGRELAALYEFPAGDGTGQSIAILEFGGGYRDDDLTRYFSEIGVPAPSVEAVSVDGARNDPSTPDSADGEVMLDIEVTGAVAPAARQTIYFAPNTSRGFIDAVTTAVHDSSRRPSVISISWGAAESFWTAQTREALDSEFQAAGLLGITICVASGDDGSSDRGGDGLAHVDYPASSPWVLGCGGTRIEVADSTITSEVVWNDGAGSATGGGVSELHPLPEWQAAAGVPPSANDAQTRGRGVPDVAGNASPATGYWVRVDGVEARFGGTSAVAPLWAALVALLNEELDDEVGFLNPQLYGESGAFRDITRGDNGAYDAAAGWDACTGLGRPIGTNLVRLLRV
jgi:kumamolisin